MFTVAPPAAALYSAVCDWPMPSARTFRPLTPETVRLPLPPSFARFSPAFSARPRFTFAAAAPTPPVMPSTVARGLLVASTSTLLALLSPAISAIASFLLWM